jgi:hypothetical protein
VNSQSVCFTGGLGPVRGRVAPCAPESVYIAFSKNSAFLVKDLPHSYGQRHMSESIDVTSGIAPPEAAGPRPFPVHSVRSTRIDSTDAALRAGR